MVLFSGYKWFGSIFYSVVLRVKSTLDVKINKGKLTKTSIYKKKNYEKNLYKNHMLSNLQFWLKIYGHWTALASSRLEYELQIFPVLVFSQEHNFNSPSERPFTFMYWAQKP